jgi:anaerobic ribonucleoside-triphosphate reductase activating protein
MQGCSRACPGCFNPLSHSFSGGSEIPVEALAREIPHCGIDGITVSGGEPFEQKAGLKELLTICLNRRLHTMVYTGFTYEELRCFNDRDIETCLSMTDMLVDGPYEKDIPPVLPWCGSGNQRILSLKNGRPDDGPAIEFSAENRAGEITIDGSGAITATGIFDSALLQSE